MNKNITINSAQGVPWVLLSGLGFSINAVFVRWASTYFPPSELLFYRAAIGTLIISIIMARKSISWKSKFQCRLWIRGTTGVLATLSYYLALTKLPLATTSTLGNINGLCLAILGVSFLGDPLKLSTLGSLILGLIGITFVLKPDFNQLHIIYVMAALGNGVFTALSHFNIRTLHKKGEPEERLMFYFFAISLAYSFIWIITHEGFHPLNKEMILYILGLGITGLCAQWAITRAYKEGDVGITSVFSYFGTFFYIMWDWVLWQHSPTSLALIGMICIIVSGIWVSKR
jgi:S-adenosylmethionine uptake transporter